MDFTIRADAAAGPTAINLLGSTPSDIGDRRTFLNEGGLTLAPAPTNRADDPIDGRVAVAGRIAPPRRTAPAIATTDPVSLPAMPSRVAVAIPSVPAANLELTGGAPNPAPIGRVDGIGGGAAPGGGVG